MNQHMLIFSAAAGTTDTQTVVTLPFFRPHKLYTSVDGLHQGYIDGFLINRESVFVDDSPIDLWLWSVIHWTQQQAKFLELHGLKGKTELEIQDYLDDNGLVMPDSPRLDLPTCKAGDVVHLKGHFVKPTGFSLIGTGP